ncbi:MAG: hydantoinase B/oxoprolinase family protein [Thermodesulfobacteriota bacterium]|nr:hydantoinase B/oxoprolinase family protein [Thermodesulfobacteriota bacterium]
MDPITLEVVQESFISIVREMRANLIRTAYSSILYEARDFSCVIMDPQGQLIAQAEDNPSHVFPIPWSVKLMFERFGKDIHSGDIFLHNDPYTGGTHLNDVALIFPVFVEEKLTFFPVIRAHWGDVGGMTPGSLSGGSKEIFQEGIRIPILKVYESGRPNRGVLDLLFSNMRVPYEREGDFQAIMGTCRVAEKRIKELLGKYGKEAVEQCVETSLRQSEQRMRKAISAIPPETYTYEAYLDCSGDSFEPVIVKTKIKVEGDHLTVDFLGSSSQTKGPLNAGPAVAPTGAFIILKSFLDPDGPINHGAFRPIHFINPEGSVLNARYPAPCGGFSEIRRCVESAVMGALAKAIPDRVTGDIKGTANHVYISGADPQSGETFIFYEYPAGGTGAFNEGDGNNTVRSFTEGDFGSIQPVESIENLFPLIVEKCELRTDSGGDGKTRGGLGLRREIKVLTEEASLSVLSDKNMIPPFGVLGGFWGAPNRFGVIRKEKWIAPSSIPGKVTCFPLEQGDMVVMETSGGGGYGDPLERDPKKIQKDFGEGLLTKEKAETRYGVIFKGKEIDLKKTDPLRERLRKERVYFRIQRWDDEEYKGTKRFCFLSLSAMRNLELKEGDLVELVNPRSAPLRAWVTGLEVENKGAIYLGKPGMEILGVKEGERIELRRIQI